MMVRVRFICATAALLGMGMATAHADAWDRDRESGSMRQQQLRESISREHVMAADHTMSGHAFGRDTMTTGNIGREFKSAADMAAHMNTQTQIRATAGHESPASEVDVLQPDGTHALTTPAVAEARDAQRKRSAPAGDVETLPLTTIGKDIVNGSSSGHKLGSDTIHVGDIYQEFKSKADMMAHLNVATSMRISSGEAGGPADDVGTARDGSMGPVARDKQQLSPARMTDKQLEILQRAGAKAGRASSSADVEDKTP